MPKLIDHDAFRRTLAERCYAVFAAKGVEGVTMKELAAAAGVSPGTFYHYFPTKDALFQGVIEELSTADLQRATLRIQQGQTWQERFAFLRAFLLEEHDTFTQQLLLLLDYQRHQPTSPRVQEHVREAYARYRQALVDLLELPDPLLASLLLCTFDGLLLGRFLDVLPASFTDHLELLGEVFALLLIHSPHEESSTSERPGGRVAPTSHNSEEDCS